MPTGSLAAAAPASVETPLPAHPVLAFRTAVPAAAWAAVARLDSWRWPLDGTPRPVRRFDPPPQPWLPGHRGVDLAAEPGTPVLAAGAGVVRYAGTLAGRGVVSVAHPDGLITTYEPVQASVQPGEQVDAGTVLGALTPGHPGCPVAACLHWGLRRGAAYLDPLAVLGLARVRLLPTR
ncbi:M23 family metallopeptidase [Catellatospora tritici]|uniref:M23 family metallopeptidase n=1 Tax=Catellatospora tritici TaxID=2851566 RepID=UPI001C2DCD3F|nr:M23 family metallopeptidase [Catellatospora tritici]MBV1848629.1 M23 family metallopeptidase [Catellatospora tritici]